MDGHLQVDDVTMRLLLCWFIVLCVYLFIYLLMHRTDRLCRKMAASLLRIGRLGCVKVTYKFHATYNMHVLLNVISSVVNTLSKQRINRKALVCVLFTFKQHHGCIDLWTWTMLFSFLKRMNPLPCLALWSVLGENMNCWGCWMMKLEAVSCRRWARCMPQWSRLKADTQAYMAAGWHMWAVSYLLLIWR